MTSRQVPYGHNASNLISWMDGFTQNEMRTEQPPSALPIPHPRADQCGWTPYIELYRTLLAFATLPVVLQIMEILEASPRESSLMLCAQIMSAEVCM